MSLRRMTWRQVRQRAAERPEGYVEELRRLAVEIDEAGLTLDSRDWQRLRRTYGSPPKQKAPDRCPYRVRTCCGQPDACGLDGGDCTSGHPADCLRRMARPEPYSMTTQPASREAKSRRKEP